MWILSFSRLGNWGFIFISPELLLFEKNNNTEIWNLHRSCSWTVFHKIHSSVLQKVSTFCWQVDTDAISQGLATQKAGYRGGKAFELYYVRLHHLCQTEGELTSAAPGLPAAGTDCCLPRQPALCVAKPLFWILARFHIRLLHWLCSIDI
jgi:hypothetical protein